MTVRNPAGWTFETLKDYFEARFKSAEVAIAKNEVQTEQRFANVNEFRGALNDLSLRMIPRAEYNAQHQALIERFEALVRRVDAMQLALTDIAASDRGKQQGLGFVGSMVLGTIALLSVLTLGVSVFIHGH